MAEAGRSDHRGVIDALELAPHRFEFFRAIALLERAAQRRRGLSAAGASAGPSDPVAIEGVALRSSLDAEHPRGDISAVRREEDQTYVVELAWAGLTGHGGFMSDFYTFELRRRALSGDHALADLFGVLENRMLALLFRAWQSRRAAAWFERVPAPAVSRTSAAFPSEGQGPMDRFIAATIGLVDGAGASGEGLARAESARLFPFAGHLSNRRRPAAAVKAILSAMLEAEIEVVQFVGRWIEIPTEERGRLGGRSSRLGRDASLLGERCWDVQSAILLRLGPLDAAQFDDALPGAPLHTRLAELARSIVGPDLDLLIQPVLRSSEVAGAELPTSRGAPRGRAFEVGRNAFAASRRASRDFDGAIFPLRGRAASSSGPALSRPADAHEQQDPT